MKKLFFILLLAVVLLTVLFKFILMPNSRGGISEFIKGQTNLTQPDLKRDISLEGGKEDPYNVELEIDLKNPVNKISDKFLSFSLDVSSIVGGKWWDPEADEKELRSGSRNANLIDLENPKLNQLTKNLAPAYLRIGGSESDKIFYDLGTEKNYQDKNYESTLTKKRWDEVNRFAERNKLDLIFTLNSGPSERNNDGSWNNENAEELLRYSKEQNYKISAWELGNELNVYWYIFGPSNFIKPIQYKEDGEEAKKLVDKYYPEADFNGQGSAYWPMIGEPLSFFYKFTEEYLTLSGNDIDKILWHYYPQQSRRGPIATRRANPTRLLNPEYLDEVAHWAKQIINWRDKFAPEKPIWMGETGNAQFGGEPGVSDVYISGLWWLDQLGILALYDHEVVIRQTLVGLDYGLLDEETFDPRPDYWNSVLWKALMGTTVYKTKTSGEDKEKLRVYTHSSARNDSSFLTILAINLDHKKNAIVSIPKLKGYKYEVFSITTNDIYSKKVLLNGNKLGLENDFTIPEIKGILNRPEHTPFINVSPLSYSFILFYK